LRIYQKLPEGGRPKKWLRSKQLQCIWHRRLFVFERRISKHRRANQVLRV